MTIQLSPLPVQRFYDNNNNPLVGGQLYSYIAGTSTPQATYTDATGGTANANPTIMNSRGECNVWMQPGVAYKLVLEDSVGNVIWTVDQVVSGISPSTIPTTFPGLLLAQRYFSSGVTYTPTAGTNSVVVTVVGGGGGGGGSSLTTSAQVSAGSGGAAGGWAKRRILSGFSGATITVGGAGAGGLGTGAPGGTGGTTSFGSFVSATGGAGGQYGSPLSSTTPTIQGFAFGGVGSGGDVNGNGGIGMYAVYFPIPTSGAGGSSILGAGAIWTTSSGNGIASTSYGSGGGGGACAPSSGTSAIGGAGATGLVIVEEYS